MTTPVSTSPSPKRHDTVSSNAEGGITDAIRDCSIQEKQRPPGLLKKEVQHQVYDWREGDPYEPCAGRGFTPYEAYWQKRFKSCHKLFYVCQHVAFWSLGSKVILKDRPYDESNIEADNMRFLKENTTVPVPGVIHDWKEDDGSYHLIQDRIDGESLERVWDSLGPEDHDRIASQAAESLVQLRSLTSDKVQNIKGNRCRNNGLIPKNVGLLEPMSSDDEVWGAMDKSLSHVDQSLRDRLKEKMPPTAPFTFTHGDLSIVNIMVKDGNFAGLIDLEYSAYFPSWWEYTRNAIWFGYEDRDWKDMLCKHMRSHNSDNEAAFRWYRACNSLARNPDGEQAKARLEELFEGED
ncbi:Uu.00g070410.m01.CDS01 [Anthostomella pinea]|uniref:Uu.00g070410.m01.CDS01 n=1 Tax=Anthostomella pinea TaxID=933095 RepID=A0AAI8VUQ4_9PEZI|nr:Uu.00g070410.m01.CDS01 [Anthostomella pinea]